MAHNQTITAEEWERFLLLLEDGNTPGYAAKEVGISRAGAYKRRDRDEKFAAAWTAAYRAGTERLEQIATERAAAKSDALLKFLLQARDPDRFSQRHTLTGPNGGPVQFETGSSDIGL